MTWETAEEIEFFVNLFETWRLPAKDWTHPAHLVTATYYLHKYGYDAGLARVRKNIKAFNVANGGKNTDTEGYHETITVFYMKQINELVEDLQETTDLKMKVTAVLTSSLMDTKYVYNFYEKDALLSKKARLAYIEPMKKN